MLGSDGHEYLIINLDLNSQSIEHYIECAKCKKQNDSLYSLILCPLSIVSLILTGGVSNVGFSLITLSNSSEVTSIFFKIKYLFFF